MISLRRLWPAQPSTCEDPFVAGSVRDVAASVRDVAASVRDVALFVYLIFYQYPVNQTLMSLL